MIMKFSRIKMVSAILLISSGLSAQTDQLSIDSCYLLARQNYPQIKKQDLIARSGGFSLENAARTYLPQLSVTGQATYQSRTIDFHDVLPAAPPNSVPTLSKDQYKIQAEISQQIYDGGSTANQKELIRAKEAVEQQALEVNLNTLKDRVNQIYFSILLMNEQLKQNEIRKTDLQGALDKATAALENGSGFRSNVDELKAELINVDMSGIEFKSNRSAYLQMLSLLTGRRIDEATLLAQPEPPPLVAEINRPELKLFDLRKETFGIQEKQLKSGYLPKLNAFIQGAYGRPTLNFIDNAFGTWWMGGLRLNWSLGSLYTLKNSRNLLHIDSQNQDIEKETFLYNTRLTLGQENADIKKYSELIQKDDAVISLRASVSQSAKAQLDNGVITVHEYINKLNEENLARQSRILHHIQLLQAQYNFKSTSGN
jgi:outer membrane protein TolC